MFSSSSNILKSDRNTPILNDGSVQLATYDRMAINMLETQILYYDSITTRKGALLNTDMKINVHFDRCLARSSTQAPNMRVELILPSLVLMVRPSLITSLLYTTSNMMLTNETVDETGDAKEDAKGDAKGDAKSGTQQKTKDNAKEEKTEENETKKTNNKNHDNEKKKKKDVVQLIDIEDEESNIHPDVLKDLEHATNVTETSHISFEDQLILQQSVSMQLSVDLGLLQIVLLAEEDNESNVLNVSFKNVTKEIIPPKVMSKISVKALKVGLMQRTYDMSLLCSLQHISITDDTSDEAEQKENSRKKQKYFLTTDPVVLDVASSSISLKSSNSLSTAITNSMYQTSPSDCNTDASNTHAIKDTRNASNTCLIHYVDDYNEETNFSTLPSQKKEKDRKNNGPSPFISTRVTIVNEESPSYKDAETCPATPDVDVRIRTMAIFFNGKSIGHLLKYIQTLTPPPSETNDEKVNIEKKETQEIEATKKDQSNTSTTSFQEEKQKEKQKESSALPPLRLSLDWEAISVYVTASPLQNVVENAKNATHTVISLNDMHTQVSLGVEKTEVQFYIGDILVMDCTNGISNRYASIVSCSDRTGEFGDSTNNDRQTSVPR